MRGFSSNRIVRFIAGVILLIFGLRLILSEFLPEVVIGSFLSLVGLGTLFCQGILMHRERQDPYDLKRLWQTPEFQEVPEEGGPKLELVYCHRCGSSMSAQYSHCPHCGIALGS